MTRSEPSRRHRYAKDAWLVLAWCLAFGAPMRAFAQDGAAIEPVDTQPADAEAVEDAPSEAQIFGFPTPIEDPGGQALRPFLEGLRRVQVDSDHQVRVMMYGASHTAADFFVHVLRERLQQRFGDAGHGFIMPARPWRSYRHLGGLSVESPNRHWEEHRVRATTHAIEPLGWAGMAVESSRAGTFGRLDTGTEPAGRFVFYYLEQPGGGDVDVLLDGHRAARIVTRADAIGPGIFELTTEDAHHVIEVRVRGNGPVRLFGCSVEREQPGVIVDNLGLNGARANSHLLWDEAIHTQYLRRLAPDLVILGYGTNEAGDDDHPIEDYEVELRRVVARVRGTVPNAACVLVGPSDRPMRDEAGTIVDRPRTAQINEVQRRVSRDFGCGFFDMVAFAGGPLSTARWAVADPPHARGDLVHFTVRGYLRLGEELLAALLSGYDAYLESAAETMAVRPTPIDPAAP